MSDHRIGARASVRRGLGALLAVLLVGATLVLTATAAHAAPGSVRLQLGALVVNEGDGTIDVTVERVGGDGGAFAVQHQVVGGTAVPGVDFTGGNGTVAFATGQTTATFPVTILDPGVFGGDVTVVIRLLNPTNGATLGAPNQITITILDNDVSTVEFSQVCYQTFSPILPALPAVVNVIVTRSGATGGTATVNWSVTGGSATAAQFTIPGGNAGPLTFAPGIVQQVIPVTVLPQPPNVGAPNVSIDFRLSGPAGVALGTRTEASLTIRNNQADVPPNPGNFSMACRRVEVLETAGNVPIPVDRTDSSSTTASVTFSTQGGSAAAGTDYVAVVNGLLGPYIAGALLPDQRLAIVTILFNPAATGTRTFDVVLTGATSAGGPPNPTLLGDTRTTVYIRDTSMGEVFLDPAAYTVRADGRGVQVRAVRPGGGATTTITYGTFDGSAVAGRDYEAVSGSLQFRPGETVRTFTVPILNDGAAENRSFGVFIAGPMVGLPDEGTVTITPAVPVPPPSPPRTERVAGGDRITTAVAASQVAYPQPGTATVAILARDDVFADALAGTPLAKAKGGPLLLTGSTSLSVVTESELLRVLPRGRTVYLLGGDAALAPGVADRLLALGYQVVRFAGVDRFHTAVLVSKDGLGNPGAFLVADGVGFPDALSAGAAAANIGGGVLLTNGGSLPLVTFAYLAFFPGAPTWAIGGPAAAALPGATPVVGATRYDTSARTAQTFFTAPPSAGVASGTTFPDGLSGGALMALKSGPLLLTDPATLPATVAAYLTANRASIVTAYIIGGTAAVSLEVQQQVAAALG